ncbi:MAG: D-inositol-3-phosphate glycosyltransferase [Acidimicrobiia bacterium]|nr:MAG: D-inositol-3-phosphate glycosyltransferase [Acidimicrobiia bacterium]
MIRQVAYLAMHSSPLNQPGIGNAGGMNVYVDELATTMASMHIEAVVFTRRTDPRQTEVVQPVPGYRVVHIDAGPPQPLPIPDLVSHVGAFGEGIVDWTKRNRKQFDVVHSHYWLSGWAGVLVKQALGLPLANSFHTLGRVKDAAHGADEPQSSAARLRTEDEVIALSDCVVAATPYEFADLLEHYGASPERLFVSPPGVNHRLFTPGDRGSARLRIGLGSEPTVLFVGRIQAHKGIDTAVRALSEIPSTVAAGEGETQLVVVGGPSGEGGAAEVDHLHNLAVDLGLSERVHFVPPQPHDQLADFYRAADVLVMPSRSESFGLVAVEAQACGLPVVAARVGGLAYAVADTESGLLVEGHEPKSFAAAIIAILDHPEFGAELAGGAARFANRFSWPAAADRFRDLYQDMARGARR